MLHLSSLGLRAIPSDVWGIAANLIRLDLSYNLITNLPKAVSQMASLQQLWLNDNPYLCELPPEMEMCKKLQVGDDTCAHFSLFVHFTYFAFLAYIFSTLLSFCGIIRCLICGGRAFARFLARWAA